MMKINYNRKEHHLTKLDRAAIEYMITNGVNVCSSKHCQFNLKHKSNGAYILSRTQQEDDWGRKVVKTYNTEIEIVA